MKNRGLMSPLFSTSELKNKEQLIVLGKKQKEITIIMNIFKGRWPQLIQNLSTIIYLSIVQIWLNFNFPAHSRLGSPWNIIVGIMASIACLLAYISVFAFPEKYVTLFNLEFFDDSSNPILFKRIFTGFMLAVFHITSLYLWHIDYYGLTNTWYIILYANNSTALILLYRAIKRYKNVQSHFLN